jgi:hypothetical protein
MLDTTISRAASRSTYSTMPVGIGHPPTETAMGAPASTTTSSTAAMTSTSVSVVTDTITWVRR